MFDSIHYIHIIQKNNQINQNVWLICHEIGKAPNQAIRAYRRECEALIPQLNQGHKSTMQVLLSL